MGVRYLPARVTSFTMSYQNHVAQSHLQTRVLHADQPDSEVHQTFPVAPSISVSTTFKEPHPDSALGPKNNDLFKDPHNAECHIYSRYGQDTRMRAERVISSVVGGHALTFSSGLSAAAAALDFYMPSTVAIRRGYFGVHEVLKKYCYGRNVKIIDLDDEYPMEKGAVAENCPSLRLGTTLVWLETPLNPTGEARDIRYYAKKAHEANGYIIVDATLAPPPLQDPFKYDVDMIMHSATKYFGGHSDLLAGILATRNVEHFHVLWHDRSQNGATPGNLENFLLLRSLRTMPLRVRHQSATASKIVAFFDSLTKGKTPDPDAPSEITDGKFIAQVWHSDLQPRRANENEIQDTEKDNHDFDPKEQMPNGGSPTFGILTATPKFAKYLPFNVHYMVVCIFSLKCANYTIASYIARWCRVAD